MSICDRIRQLRASLKLSQGDFGAKIGMSQGIVSLIETGAREPSRQTVRAIALRFGVDENWLLKGEGTMEQKKETYTQQLAELLQGLPEEQREFIASHLLGTVQGMKMQDALNSGKKPA